MTPNNEFPGGSRSRVTKAGANVRAGSADTADYLVIEEWRASHRNVLNTFQSILRNRTRGANISVAQRHKRRRTIFDKLQRFPKMELGRMDDVAGCRLIFDNVHELEEFREEFHRARFKHKRRNDVNKYDYIKSPKASGYRGIHDVYEYDVNSQTGKRLAGLYIEIQYRTLVQHAWATAVEVIGFVTASQPKFQKGDSRYMRAMVLASELLARAHEGLKGPVPDLTDREVLTEFIQIDEEIQLTRNLRGLNEAKNEVSEKRNTILIFHENGKLEMRSFREAPEALRALFEIEKEHPEKDVVLVRADSGEEVRLAFRNYFSDARDFLSLIGRACTKLGGRSSNLELSSRSGQFGGFAGEF